MYPIPPVAHPLQCRALGLIRGVLRPVSSPYQGLLVTEDREEYPVTPGRAERILMKGFDACLKVARQHWFFVQPQPRQGKTLGLSVIQILSVPVGHTEFHRETTSEPFPVAPEESEEGFHIRGLVNPQGNHVMVTVKRKPKGDKEFPPLVLRLEGFLPQAQPGEFWDLQAERDGHDLVLVDGSPVHIGEND